MNETYYFDLILKNCDDILADTSGTHFDDWANKLYEAGCDDAMPGISCGVVIVGFAREAESLKVAILSAIADVQTAGYEVAEVRPTGADIYNEINQDLAVA